MEHAPILTLVVITLLQLCRAQSSDTTPEWYAANDISDTNFSPKPITELFSTETSFSPENPIVVVQSSSPTSSSPGEVSSPNPTTVTEFSESTYPPNVIPLSSPETPSSLLIDISESTLSDTQPPSTQMRTSILPQQISTESTVPLRTTQYISQLSNRGPGYIPRLENSQMVRQNPNRIPQRQMQPQNIQFMLPPQVGNRNSNAVLQMPPNAGQPNYFVLYQQAPQNIQNIPPGNSQGAPQQTFQSGPMRNSVPQQIPARNPNMVINRQIVQQPTQNPNQFIQQPNAIPRFNMQSTNGFPYPQPSSQPFNQQQNNGSFNDLHFNQFPSDQAFVYPQPYIQINNESEIQQPLNQNSSNQPPMSPNNFRPVPPSMPNNVQGLTQRPLKQRKRVNGSRLNNRGSNRMQTQKVFPCQGANGTVLGPATTAATKTQTPVITIRLKPSQGSRASLQNAPSVNTIRSTTANPLRQNSQVNIRNYERCLNSCRDKKDRICATPEGEVEINLDSLKGFPSMCHMACHNTFRANPIYGKIANGRCGKLRTRIQTVDKTKIRREDLKKTQYTIISNVPGTVVELAH